MATRRNTRKSKAQPKPLWDISLYLPRSGVIGIVLVLIAGITLLSLVTSSNGVLTGAWIEWLQALFGVGRWAFPLVIGLIGVWMIIRAIEQMPNMPWQHPLGMTLLLISFIIAATLWTPTDPSAAGGQVGLFVTQLIANAVGKWGAWAIATFLAIFGVACLFDQILLRLFLTLRILFHTWQPHLQNIQFKPSIQPVLPLPSGQLPWWKRLQERVQHLRTNPPTITVSLPGSTLVTPTAEPRTYEPPRTAQSAPAASQPVRPPATTPTPASELLMPRIVGAGQDWRLPRLEDMLRSWDRRADSDDLIRQQGRIIQETLALFGVPADFEGAYKGPSVTQYLIKPGYIERTVNGEVKRMKIKVSKIAGLSNDLALALAAASVRIEAPIPGTNYVGIEVPNHEGNIVGLKELMESEAYQNMKGRLRIALGEDVKGQPIVSDMARMPHLLIAGATGTGKSVCINSIISCLLLTHTPDTLRLLMVDPKMVELSVYNGVPHLLSPVVTEVDKAAGVLFWAVKEMERRYTLCSKVGARDLVRYNDYLTKRSEKPLPYIVVVVDEMADLMMAAPEEVEKHICRIAQMARAVGIHLIIATQRPSVDVITGLIKANFPSRIAFAVTSQTDSRVILDVPGAERLLGRGDMLFMAPDASKLERLQGAYLHDDEINKIVHFWKGIRTLEQPGAETVSLMPDNLSSSVEAPPATLTRSSDFTAPEEKSSARSNPPSMQPLVGLSQPSLFAEIEVMKKIAGRDELFDQAVRLVQEEGRGSVSLLQRKLRIGYNRAARLVDQLEEAGILGADDCSGQGRPYLGQDANPPDSSSGTTPPRIIGGADDSDPSATKPQIWM